jgi:very-short-patch-repair endonuclease
MVVKKSAIVKGYADEMRNNMTMAEQDLCKWFDYYGVPYKSQVVECCFGQWYILDFVIGKKKKICVEVDGSVHGTPEQKERDRKRSNLLIRKGYKVLRISNGDVMNPSAVERLIGILRRNGIKCNCRPDLFLNPSAKQRSK